MSEWVVKRSLVQGYRPWVYVHPKGDQGDRTWYENGFLYRASNNGRYAYGAVRGGRPIETASHQQFMHELHEDMFLGVPVEAAIVLLNELGLMPTVQGNE